MMILPGRQMYEIWRNITIPIYLKVHIFNVTNVDEILRGGKPRLDEVGPFVYIENRTFRSISFSDEDPPKTVNFLESRQYIFQPLLSVADPKQITVMIPDLFFGVRLFCRSLD
ncbi:hypothetical protein CRM22_010815 [Opisthorchis felineus]|uniref:Scavenger receptor class B member 1 n=1 Tax=Opisthorchis felineus TaxID=147828 RepID=A0A4S2KLS6_OPIFE|nr:hypothetical protein CRM22_010815 [Opisthorchis felineus]